MSLFNMIRQLLKQSPRMHLRDTEIGSLTDMVGVIDRFIDGNPREHLEWDDFISWENSNPGVEKVRLRIAALEGEFFSNEEKVRWRAHMKLVDIRNETAAIVGIRSRATVTSQHTK
jgi:hypothetical protein